MPADVATGHQATPGFGVSVSCSAESLHRCFPDLVWSGWYRPELPPASDLGPWVACDQCRTRAVPLSSTGRDPRTHDLVAVASCCPDCGACATTRLVTAAMGE